jgi:hypothetical protein
VKLGGLATFAQRRFKLELLVEMILDHALVAARDEDQMFNTGLAGLIDGQLNDWAVDNGEHLLGHGLGGGEKARAEACNRKYRSSDRTDH